MIEPYMVRARKVLTKPHIEMLGEAAPRAGFFEYAEFQAVLSRLQAHVQPLARFAFITGWRWKSEVSPLTWSQVDLDHGTVTIDAGRTKGGEPRVFVMTRELKALLKEQRTSANAVEQRTGKPCPLVFHRDGERITWFYDQWRTACTEAGVPGRLIHDLRRTAIRNLVRAGVSESVAMRMSGHKTRAIFDRYNVSSEGDLRAAAALLSTHHKALARTASKAAKKPRTTKVLQSKRGPAAGAARKR